MPTTNKQPPSVAVSAQLRAACSRHSCVHMLCVWLGSWASRRGGGEEMERRGGGGLRRNLNTDIRYTPAAAWQQHACHASMAAVGGGRRRQISSSNQVACVHLIALRPVTQPCLPGAQSRVSRIAAATSRPAAATAAVTATATHPHPAGAPHHSSPRILQGLALRVAQGPLGGASSPWRRGGLQLVGLATVVGGGW